MQLDKCVFRYRSLEALLGEFQELERQSIYVSPPEQLNDPMEGMRQIYWRGDEITWRNFLRHYIFCLCIKVFKSHIYGKKACTLPDGVAVLQTLDDLPTPIARELHQACLDPIEAGLVFNPLLELLNSKDRDISAAELGMYFTIIHVHWLSKIHSS